ncbi:MAG: AMP-binding protein [Clostridia bacterium]|nr:AMP-binding protein [Clostridia bacterium]
MMGNRLYLDNWIGQKIGLTENEELTREKICAYQLEKIRENIEYVKQKSPFYREKLKDIKPEDIKTPDDVCRIPLTTQAELIEHGRDMICVPEDEINYIITIGGDENEEKAKKIYFTEEDQRLTIDCFHHGMKYLCNTGERVLILLPCKEPGSVGNLLEIGLDRMDVEAVCFNELKSENDYKDVLKLVENQRIHCIVGRPRQVEELARQSVEMQKNELFVESLRKVLLTGEYVSLQSCEVISEAWDCRVYEHYGMTEMGFGGGILCTANGGKGMAYPGYHLREADLYVEVLERNSNLPAKPGEYGEIAFTTLTRAGMPLIRYRTGDISRWIDEPCRCGSVLRRLDKVRESKFV